MNALLWLKQKYRRDGLTEEQVDERIQKKWFELLETRQKWRREGWSEERTDKHIQKLRDQQTQWDNHLKNWWLKSRPVNGNRRKIWPSPKENVRVKLNPCLNCGHQPTFVKEWWTGHFRDIEWAFHRLRCPNYKRELNTFHNWRPDYPMKKSVPVQYREYSRLQMISAWNHWNTPRAKTTPCAVQKLRQKVEVQPRHIY